MSDFNDTIARMKQLYTYGVVKESDNKINNHTLEFTKKAADGKYYGIVKECNHYFIKQTVDGKQNIAESYDYIGGYMNKKAYQYDSYANALKNLELKLSSINEAHEAKIDVTTLDPFKKEIVLAEASDKMKDSIARQRQIMYNAGMIMGESKDYAVKGGPACDTKQPEAVTSVKGDRAEEGKEVEAEPDFKGTHVERIKDATPFEKNPSKVNEENEKEWGSEGLDKGEDPATIGWDMDDQKKPCEDGECTVNEEDEKEWGSEGLPSDAEAGVGSPDGHLMEGEDEDDVVLDDEDETDNEDELNDDDFDLDDEDGEETDVEDSEEEGDEDFDLDDEGESEFEIETDDEKVDETDPESVRAEIERLQDVLNNLEDTEEPLDGEVDFDEVDVKPVDDDEDFEDDDEDFEDDEEDDEFAFESKKKIMNRIIESVVHNHIMEDKLNDFGKHVGYRKQPMTLPTTGQDKNEHGEDINDDSVHNEEPFGKQIGDGKPFNVLVNAVTADVKYQLTHGIPIDNKKKEN